MTAHDMVRTKLAANARNAMPPDPIPDLMHAHRTPRPAIHNNDAADTQAILPCQEGGAGMRVCAAVCAMLAECVPYQAMDMSSLTPCHTHAVSCGEAPPQRREAADQCPALSSGSVQLAGRYTNGM